MTTDLIEIPYICGENNNNTNENQENQIIAIDDSKNDEIGNIMDDENLLMEKISLTPSILENPIKCDEITSNFEKDTRMMIEFDEDKVKNDNSDEIIDDQIIINDDDNDDLITSNRNFCDKLIIGGSSSGIGSGDDESIGIGPTSERWAPLGADNEETIGMDHTSNLTSSITSAYFYPNDSTSSSTRIKSLEEEQEILTTSLMALTSHFAQVQFRLRQIVEAPPSDRDQLLVNLEEFAFRGIPEITGNLNPNESEEVISNLERARQRQFELIDRLKRQLSELEKFAYESGAPVLPQSILVEKQKVIIDELKNKLNLNVNDNDLPQLSTEDLRNQVDTAIGEFVGPLKMKEQLVAQLKTQITDLERFIAFLQGETTILPTNDNQNSTLDTLDAYNSYAAKKKHISANNASTLAVVSSTTGTGSVSEIESSSSSNLRKSTQDCTKNSERNKECSRNQYKDNCNGSTSSATAEATSSSSTSGNNDATYSIGSFAKAHNLLDKAATLLQMLAVAQFGCGSNRFQKNHLKKTAKCNHWGDLRAQLEVDIQEIISLILAQKRDHKNSFSPSSDDSDEDDTSGSSCSSSDKSHHRHQSSSRSRYHHRRHHHYHSSTATGRGSRGSANATGAARNLELTTVVRKNFTLTLQKLIQHGLRIENEAATNLVPFIGCLNPSHLRESHHRYGSSDFFGGNSTHHYMDDNSTNEYSDGNRQLHAWELILEYYNIKNGEQYNETPARKLSQSFNLDIVGGTAISNKQSLLSVIGSIIAMHSPYKRSYNSHFKAFVCAGLNSHKLVHWLNLIFQCTELVETYYADWSYVAKTGFRDSLKSIDRLMKYDFNLPVDLAVRQFQNIKDVFM